jgi:hypothetical protein
MSEEFTNAVFLKVNVDDNDVSWLCEGGDERGGMERENGELYRCSPIYDLSLHTKMSFLEFY